MVTHLQIVAFVVATSLAVTAAPGAGIADPHQSDASSADVAVLEDCRERFFIAPGVEEEVRTRVPAQFELGRNSAGQPLLYVTAIRCERYTIDGDTRPTTVAAFGASIAPPDGVACSSAWPVIGDVRPNLIGSCNTYLLFVAYDNPRVVKWAKAVAVDLPVSLVDDLRFRQGDLDPARLGAPFTFEAPSTPSPYSLDLVVRERPIETPLTGTFWFAGSNGLVRFRFETSALAMGEASGSLVVAEGSEMATVFGTTEPTAQNGFPLLAGTTWRTAHITRSVVAGSP